MADLSAETSSGDLNLRARRLLDEARRCAAAATEVHDRMGRLRGEMATSLRDGHTEIARARGIVATGAEELQQVHNFASMGRVAASVAHDLNNLLTVILNYGNAAMSRAGGEGARDDLDHIVRAAQHAAVLTRQILREGGPGSRASERVALDVDAVIEMNRPILARLLGTITLEITLGGQHGYVRAHPGEVEQVLLNLAVNARDAMHGEGRLAIETAQVDRCAASTDEDAPALSVPCVMLAVHDTGAGMDEATLAQVFEPFFTTKDPGRAGGLGLATVARIARDANAQVEIESSPGRGCSVRLFFPRIDVEEAVKLDGAAAYRRATASQIILVVEDDPMVCRAIEVSLDTLGYRVIAAGSAAEALEVLAHAEQRVDLVVTDVEMPAMSGRQLAAVARSLRPDLRILFVSGLGASALATYDEEDSILEKPFTIAALADHVYEALSQPAEACSSRREP